MKRRKLLPRVASFALAGFLAFGLIPPQKAEADKVSDLENSKQQAQTELNNLDTELVNLLAEIDVLQGEIDQKNIDIENATLNLEAAEESVADQYENMKIRMKYMYENDQENIVSILLEADSFTDFLNQIDYANSIHEQDRDMLNTYEGTVSDVTDLKAALEAEEADLETQQSQLNTKKTNLNTMIETKKAEVADFDTQLTAAKEEAARIAAEQAAARAAAIERANAAAVTARASASSSANNTTARSSSTRAKQSSTAQSSTVSSSSDTTVEEEEETEEEDDSWVASEETIEEEEDDDSWIEPSNPEPTTGVSGGAVVGYACGFVGCPYVWGGNSLTGGCDCSGFVVQVYANFGIDLSGSRSSAALRGVGQAVDAANMQAGDIVCYSGHVAIYTGGGTIVEAQDSAHGITANRSVFCAPVLAIRRVI